MTQPRRLTLRQEVGKALLTQQCEKGGRTEAHGAAAAAAGDAAAGVVDASRGEVADWHAVAVHACQVTQATALCTHLSLIHI